MHYNAFNQPIGNPVAAHPPATLPDASGFNGSSCLLERLDDANHFTLICDCYLNHMDPQDWTYLPIDPPRDEQQVRSLVQQFTPRQRAILLCDHGSAATIGARHFLPHAG